MVDFEVNGLTVQVYPDNIKIINSYKVNNKKEMKQILKEIIRKAPIYNRKRSFNALVREWKCHNRFYNMGILVSHTKDCDFETNEALYRRIMYFFLGRF